MAWRSHKFGAKPKNGYASTAEADRAAQLQMLEAGGVIEQLQEQVPFPVTPADMAPPINLIVDFVYVDTQGEVTGVKGRKVAEDTKGVETPVFRIKARLFQYFHPEYALMISKRASGNRFTVTEWVPRRKRRAPKGKGRRKKGS